MRVSRAQAEENRRTVIEAAGRLFRERGFEGVGLNDLMGAAGLTQGGFSSSSSRKTISQLKPVTACWLTVRKD
jgi:hypothetical protein